VARVPLHAGDRAGARIPGWACEFSFWVALSDVQPQIELIQSVSGPSIYTEWLDRHGTGFRHVGIFTDNLAADVEALEALEAQGLVVSQSGRGYGLEGGLCVFRLAALLGVVIEFIEIPRVRRPPDVSGSARDRRVACTLAARARLRT